VGAGSTKSLREMSNRNKEVMFVNSRAWPVRDAEQLPPPTASRLSAQCLILTVWGSGRIDPRLPTASRLSTQCEILTTYGEVGV
jgi:hypothetical protein